MCVRAPQSTSTQEAFYFQTQSSDGSIRDRREKSQAEFIEFISGHAFRLHTFIKVTGKRSFKALFSSVGRSPFSCGEEACILTCLLPSFVFRSLVWVFCLVHNSWRKSRVSAGWEANAILFLQTCTHRAARGMFFRRR